MLDYYGQVISYVDGSVTLGLAASPPPAPGDVKDSRSIAARPPTSDGAGLVDATSGLAAPIDALRKSVDWSAPDSVDG